MINLLLASIKNMSTSQRIEKTVDGLRQRFGVSCDLTTEPQTIAIRNGPKVIFNSTLLQSLNEDLNTLESFRLRPQWGEKAVRSAAARRGKSPTQHVKTSIIRLSWAVVLNLWWPVAPFWRLSTLVASSAPITFFVSMTNRLKITKKSLHHSSKGFFPKFPW